MFLVIDLKIEKEKFISGLPILIHCKTRSCNYFIWLLIIFKSNISSLIEIAIVQRTYMFMYGENCTKNKYI